MATWTAFPKFTAKSVESCLSIRDDKIDKKWRRSYKMHLICVIHLMKLIKTMELIFCDNSAGDLKDPVECAMV